MLKLIPGLGNSSASVDIDEQQLKRVEAIVLSMTPHERAMPHVIDGKRRQRIARGSGTQVEQVNQLLEARKQMENMMKQMGKGKVARPHAARADGDGGRSATAQEHHRKRKKRKQRTEVKETAWQSSCRLTRVGSKKNPIYRVVAADSRSPRDGKFLEIVGRYNPQTDPSMIELDEAKVKDWLGKGAQPTEAVARLIKITGHREVAGSNGRAARVPRAGARGRSGRGAGGDRGARRRARAAPPRRRRTTSAR